MSAPSKRWCEPDSRFGFYYDITWATLAVTTAGTLLYWEPFSLTVSVTTLHLVGSAVLGCISGLGIVYGAFYSTFVKRYSSQMRTRFIGLFVLIMGGQLGLLLIPTWILLTMVTTFLTVILGRTYIYIRTR